MLQFMQYHSGAPEFTPGFQWGSCYSIYSFICMFCRSLFVLLYFFFWALLLSVLLRFTNSDYLPLVSSKQLCLQLCPTQIVLLFCFSSSCVPNITSFSGLSLFDCPIGILYRLFMLIRLLKIYTLIQQTRNNTCHVTMIMNKQLTVHIKLNGR